MGVFKIQVSSEIKTSRDAVKLLLEYLQEKFTNDK